MEKQYWLLKTEPSTYSIDDLKREKKTEWYGIRNYQVRNTLRDLMRVGDEVLIYHSNCPELGIVGTGKIVSESYPDTEQWRPESYYYDPKSKQENPTWFARDVAFGKKFPCTILLSELKQQTQLGSMTILRKGNRLSITPVSQAEFMHILTLAKKGKS